MEITKAGRYLGCYTNCYKHTPLGEDLSGTQ